MVELGRTGVHHWQNGAGMPLKCGDGSPDPSRTPFRPPGSRAGHGGPWTADDVLALPQDTSHRVEPVAGGLLISPHAVIPQRVAASLTIW